MSDSGESSEISERGRLVARFGAFTLDEGRRWLARGETAIHLTPKAFDLLRLLVGEAPRVVTKRELHERLWPDSFVSDASVAELVKEIRRALGDRNREAPIIRTVHRVGYALGLDVQRLTSAPRTQHWLVFHDKRVPLKDGGNIIGRDPGADVWLDDAGVSRRHACITVDASGVHVEDLGSKNGTTLEDTAVQARAPLRDGARISFGGLPAVYRDSTAGMLTETRAPDLHR